MSGGLARSIWFGGGAGPAAARAALWPAALIFRSAVAARNALYDSGMLAAMDGGLPAVAVGNLTVGGTGKTPVAAWIASELSRRGARPAIVLRGYGGDEPAVHARLNPQVPVVVDADRAAGIRRARAMGADVAVLDDAFQHRRAARVADIVLVSAERGIAPARLLPAGPFREPVAALRRASLVLVTRKTAEPGRASDVLDAAIAAAGGIPGAVAALAPEALVPTDGGAPVPVASLAGRRVTLVTGVGEPALVADQLRALGAEVRLLAFPDHHAFTAAELAAAAGAAADADFAVCTLKDAVKIAERWPGRRPLWYVSQRLIVERGVEDVARLLDRILASTHLNPQTSG
jgi:tetraacyldisaccharide 4'-kinase